MRRAALVLAASLAGCAGGGPPPPDWQVNARQSLAAFERLYFAGESALAETEFRRARREISATGRLDLLARAELMRCAVRVASLEFDDCPGFEALRGDAGAEERAYADALAGRVARHAPAAEGDALARLVEAGVRLRRAELSPEGMARAAEIASARGWRRPLAAWLGVLKRRAEEAGEREAAARFGRRLDAVLGGGGGGAAR